MIPQHLKASKRLSRIYVTSCVRCGSASYSSRAEGLEGKWTTLWQKAPERVLLVKPQWAPEDLKSWEKGEKDGPVGQLLERGQGLLELCGAVLGNSEMGPVRTVSPIGASAAILFSTQREVTEMEEALNGGDLLSDLVSYMDPTTVHVSVKAKREKAFLDLSEELDRITLYRECRRLLNAGEIEAGESLWISRGAPISLAPTLVSAYTSIGRLPRDMARLRAILRGASDVKDTRSKKQIQFRDAAYFGLVQLCCIMKEQEMMDELIREMDEIGIRDTWSAKMLMMSSKHEEVKLDREVKEYCLTSSLLDSRHSVA